MHVEVAAVPSKRLVDCERIFLLSRDTSRGKATCKLLLPDWSDFVFLEEASAKSSVMLTCPLMEPWLVVSWFSKETGGRYLSAFVCDSRLLPV